MSIPGMSDDSEDMEKGPLPPSIKQVESMVASSNALFIITKKSALHLYKVYLDSLIPNMLTDWYLNAYQLVAGVLWILYNRWSS